METAAFRACRAAVDISQAGPAGSHVSRSVADEVGAQLVSQGGHELEAFLALLHAGKVKARVLRLLVVAKVSAYAGQLRFYKAVLHGLVADRDACGHFSIGGFQAAGGLNCLVGEENYDGQLHHLVVVPVGGPGGLLGSKVSGGNAEACDRVLLFPDGRLVVLRVRHLGAALAVRAFLNLVNTFLLGAADLIARVGRKVFDNAEKHVGSGRDAPLAGEIVQIAGSADYAVHVFDSVSDVALQFALGRQECHRVADLKFGEGKHSILDLRFRSAGVRRGNLGCLGPVGVKSKAEIRGERRRGKNDRDNGGQDLVVLAHKKPPRDYFTHFIKFWAFD